MAQHDHDHAHAGHAHDHVGPPYDEERLNAEILSDREWMFGKFISFTGWNIALIALILIILAFTQT